MSFRRFFSKWSSLAVNMILGFMLLVVLAQRIPLILEHLRFEGVDAPPVKLKLLTGEDFSLEGFGHPLILVFWATWCEPCRLELQRLNRLIKNGELSPTSVLAISSYELPERVQEVSHERGYRFMVAIDSDGRIAQQFKVAATPTVTFVGKDRKIQWMTTGLSPFLELRAKRFIDRSESF